MNGQGHIEMDVALFVTLTAAALINVFYLPHWLGSGRGMGAARCLRLAGWCILGARFGFVLFSVGDIPVTVPSAIGLFLLAIGDIAGMLSRGRKS